ncbi:MAG: LCP family protein [Patescibacteria group bacterium]
MSSNNNQSINDKGDLVKPKFTLLKIFLKTIVYCLVFELILLTITAIPLSIYLNNQLNQFLKEARVSRQEFVEIATDAWNSPASSQRKTNFLVLGIDAMENRGKPTLLTDTIMVVSLNNTTGKINLLSLPRDLWLADYQTKINALLYYGDQRDSNNPTSFPKEVIENLTQTKIDHVVVMSLDNLKELIDLLGGVEIDVPEAFVDSEFPRNDVDVNIVTDPKLLYEVVSFQKGKQIMDGELALKYIRSRHSQDEQGNDLARNNRQQEVVYAIFAKISNPMDLIKDPARAGRLFNYYQTNFEKYLPLNSLMAIGKSVVPVANQITFVGHGLDEYDETTQDGSIYHPNPKLYNNQWVYIIKDQTAFNQEIKNKLE